MSIKQIIDDHNQSHDKDDQVAYLPFDEGQRPVVFAKDWDNEMLQPIIDEIHKHNNMCATPPMFGDDGGLYPIQMTTELNIEDARQSVEILKEQALLRANHHLARSQIKDVYSAHDYSEPGYTTSAPHELICLGNWNGVSRWVGGGPSEIVDDSPAWLGNMLEFLGYELEWSDEWVVCMNCGKIVRTTADSYNCGYHTFDDGETCHECIKSEPDWIEEYLEGIQQDEDGVRCVSLEIDPAEHGYKKLNDNDERLQNGLHGGQDADPAKIKQSLNAKGIERVVFVLDHMSQFDLEFSVYVHEDEYEQALSVWSNADKRADEDPADVLKRGLQSSTIIIAELEAEARATGGIVYTQIKSDGTAEGRVVSPQDFIDGKIGGGGNWWSFDLDGKRIMVKSEGFGFTLGDTDEFEGAE